MSKEAKDKAEELIEKFGIEKAVLCVDEILKLHIFKYNSIELYKFWQQVKQEILNRQ